MEFKPIAIERNTHYGNNFYQVYSKKVNRVCTFYSDLEYFNYLSLEIERKLYLFVSNLLEFLYLLKANSRIHYLQYVGSI